MDVSHPLIAREGWPFLAVAVALAAAVHLFAGAWWAFPLWLVSLFLLQFFRDPPRCSPQAPGLVLSPADGRIVAVERAYDPWLSREAFKLSVFMNVFNVHSNRCPVGGVVKGAWYHPGKFLNAAIDKTSQENERNALWIQTKDGTDVTCVQVAGLIARRILCYVKEGDVVLPGQRFGFIRFGSRLDVYLPLSAKPRVSLGDRVYAGRDVLANLG
jgi:phosphatidylserine decarboxylase